MFKGFRDFVLRGNVVDLAVGVVIGAAFGSVVTAFVKDLLTPLIAAIAGKPDFSAFFAEVNGAKFLYGDFLNALISFLLIAAAVYPRAARRSVGTCSRHQPRFAKICRHSSRYRSSKEINRVCTSA